MLDSYDSAAAGGTAFPSWKQGGNPRTVLCVNAHIYNLAEKNPDLARILREARIVTADGMAIVWTARIFGIHIPERCNMTEAFRYFYESSDMPQNSGIMIGCSTEEAAAASSFVEKASAHCRIVASYSGYLSDDEYREIFERHSDADFIFLGMGTPRTEHVARIAGKSAPRVIAWGIGGGTVRILAGTMSEAPQPYRRLGLQWLHRLLSEPAALWERYLLGNPLFLWRLLRSRFSNKTNS